jgi:phosphoadenosine phosphosulfate reductase
MTLDEIKCQLKMYHEEGKKMFVTSSFQTQSIPLLHIINSTGISFDVLFINTGFHFPETISFRNKIVEKLGLNLIDVRPDITKIHQRDSAGQFYFVSDPDYCCYINKTQPLERHLIYYDVWISGIRADQNGIRKKMKTIESAPFKTKRFHPFLDWNTQNIIEYRKQYHLPEHPLDKNSYKSIGCAPCTRKFDMKDERNSRWFGMNKTECGLHTDLISK